MPYQWEWVQQQSGVTADEGRAAAWTVRAGDLGSDRRQRGAGAITTTLDVLIGWGRVLYTIYRLPLLRQLGDRGYRWVANNRKLFPGTTPALKQEPAWQPQRD